MEDYLRWEAKQTDVAFERTETRRTRLKRRLDCGHVIDGGEPYRYHVHKVHSAVTLTQLSTCEPCARTDVSY